MPSHYTYRPEIDGLRAIAVLSVVIFHASETVLPGGFVGVDIFFVISGFLITSIIEKEIFSGNFSIFKFYERRIRRIFPPLFTVYRSINNPKKSRLEGQIMQLAADSCRVQS